MEASKACGNSQVVLKWLIPVLTGRFSERGTGAVLDLLSRGGYRAKERFAFTIVRQSIFPAEQLNKRAGIFAGFAASKTQLSLNSYYNALVVAFGESQQLRSKHKAFLLTRFSLEMKVPRA